MLAAAPAMSAEAMQMWRCEMHGDATEEGVHEVSKAWLKAARELPGGEQLKAYVNFPVAVNAMQQVDLLFVVVAPSLESWGKFWDAYPDSEAANIEEDNHSKIVCPDSALWSSTQVGAE